MSDVATFQFGCRCCRHYYSWLRRLLVQLQFSCPCVLCICTFDTAHSIKQLAHRVYERAKKRTNERMNEPTITHNTSYFMYIHTYFYFECVFHFIRSFVPSSSLLFTSSSSFLFLYFLCVFCFNFISFALLVPFCASRFDALYSFIINKRVQSME